MISGVSAFIRTYKNMVKSSLAPFAAIAYSLHKFGKADRVQEMFGVQVEGEVSTVVESNDGGTDYLEVQRWLIRRDQLKGT